MPLLARFDVQHRPGRAPARPSSRNCSKYEQGNTDPVSQSLEHALICIHAIENNFKQILQVAKPYPAEELEWLATTTFNKAVDFYCASQDVECRCWAEKALNIADSMADGGVLHELLQSKFMGLTWDHPGT